MKSFLGPTIPTFNAFFPGAFYTSVFFSGAFYMSTFTEYMGMYMFWKMIYILVLKFSPPLYQIIDRWEFFFMDKSCAIDNYVGMKMGKWEVAFLDPF